MVMKTTTTRRQATATVTTTSRTKKIYSVNEGLKSVQTQRQYRWHFEAYLKWLGAKYSSNITPEKVLQFDAPAELERLVIEYIQYLDKEKHLKHSTINSAVSAIFHFCRMNDVWLNKEKVNRFIPEDESNHQDRAYTRKEIERLLKESDMRFRVVFLLLANGLRIGAIPELPDRRLDSYNFANT